MSFASANCLENIIGLSETTCECFEDAPIDYNVSLSGLYLDKLEGLDLNLAQAGANCEHGNVWDMLASARQSGITQFQTYLKLKLGGEYKQKNKPFSGAVGDVGYKTNLTGTGNYAGETFYTNNIRGGYMKVKRIGAMFTQTGTLDIDVYDNREYGSLRTETISTEANKLVWTSIAPLMLPLSDDGGGKIRYDFLYDRNAMPGLPKDNKINCGCNSAKKYYYDESNPNFSAVGWKSFIMVTGVSGDDVTDIETRDAFNRTSHYSNGIILDVEFVCDITDLTCQHVEDFDNGPLALAIATCIRYISGVFLIDSILASGNISFYTMTDRERLMGKKNSYNKDYQTLLSEIVTQFNISGNDCLMCDNSRGPKKRGILA